MIDWFSFGVGAIVAAVITVILMFLLLLWEISRAYMLGWHDHKEGKHVDFHGLFRFSLLLITNNSNPY